jgi:hypothetical protein
VVEPVEAGRFGASRVRDSRKWGCQDSRMSNVNFQGDRFLELAMALEHRSWRQVQDRFQAELAGLRILRDFAGLLAEAEDTHHNFEMLAHRLRELPALPNTILVWLDSGDLSPKNLPNGGRDFSADQWNLLLDAARRYDEATLVLAARLRALRDTVDELGITLEADVSAARTSYYRIIGPKRPPIPVRPDADADPWDLIGRALTSPDVEGALYIGGDVSDADVQRLERSVADVVVSSGRTVQWDTPRRGSWWRRFRTMSSKRIGEGDLDTIKRAAEVQLLDRHESEAAKNYADAIAALAAAVSDTDHAYLVAKNTILLKTIDVQGRSVIVSRVLNPREVSLFQAGALEVVLRDPETALKFLRTGAIPAEELPALEGESGN